MINLFQNVSISTDKYYENYKKISKNNYKKKKKLKIEVRSFIFKLSMMDAPWKSMFQGIWKQNVIYIFEPSSRYSVVCIIL